MWHQIHSALEHGYGAIAWCVGTLTGSVAGLAAWLFFQPASGEAVKAAWYHHPAVAAAAVAGAFTVLVQGVGWFRDWRKERAAEEEEEGQVSLDLRKLTDEQFVTLLAQKDRWHQTQLDRLQQQHREQVEFLQMEMLQKEITEYRSREFAHGAFNALNKSYGHIRKLEKLVFECGKTCVPSFEFVYQEDIWNDVLPKVEAFKQQIRSNARAVSGAPDKTENPDA